MSSGAKQVSYLIKEVTPGVTPNSGSWDVLRLTGNTLDAKVATQASNEIIDSRLSQGAVATSADMTGDLTAELSFGSFDQLLEAAFYSTWTANKLTVGDTRNTFSIAKSFTDVGVYTLFKGAHVSKFAMDVPAAGVVAATFSMACLDYADQVDTPFNAVNNPASTTPFLSSASMGTILADGVSLAGSACVSAMKLSLDNSLQVQRCLGSGKLGPGAQIATEAAITGSITLAWSQKAWQLWKNTFTRAPIHITFPLVDNWGNQYIFDFPAVEIDGSLPNGGKKTLIEVTLNFTVAKQSPTITRIPVAITSVTVTPTTASIAVAATTQLSAAVVPAGAGQAVNWSSATPSVATVNSSGLVTGVLAGTAVISATSVLDGTKLGSATITVA